MNKPGETILRLRSENARLLKALGHIRDVLGMPCPDNTCMGCGWEMVEASSAAQSALKGASVFRKVHKYRPHGKGGRAAGKGKGV